MLKKESFATENEKITDDGFIYEYCDETAEEIEIIGYRGSDTTITIPSMIESKPVVYIGDEVFYDNDSITKVIFTGNVSAIGYRTFSNCDNLIAVELCDSIDTISVEAFAYSYNLSEINLTENMFEIGEHAFSETAITEVTIGERVSILDGTAFVGCSQLENIIVSDNNKDYSSDNGVLYDKNKTQLLCCPGGKKSIEIPDGVLKVGKEAFYFVDITTINLPESLAAIGDGAFYGANISEINIPKNINHIGEYAFYACSKLLNIYVNYENVFYSDIDGVLFNKNQTKLICCPSQKSDIIIPNTVTELGTASFGCCDRISTVIIPNSVTKIGEEAFAWAENISYLFVPNSVIDIGRAAFDCEIVCNKDSYAEEYAKDYFLNYSLHEHSIKITEAVPASCIEEGLTQGQYCEICKEILVEQTQIKPTGHKIVVDTEKKATCLEKGITEGSHCSVCGEVIKKQEEIPATGHKAVVDKAVASTCIKAGKTEGSHCSVCGQVIKQQTEIPVTEHSWDNGSITKKPTADSEGEKTYTCTVCRTTKTEEIAKLTVAEKKAQKIKVTTSKKISLKNVKQKSQSFKLSAKSTSGNKVKYKLIKGNRNIKFTASSGKVTIKKGTKKGTYKIKVKMTVSGDDEYKKSSVTKTITIKVK